MLNNITALIIATLTVIKILTKKVWKILQHKDDVYRPVKNTHFSTEKRRQKTFLFSQEKGFKTRQETWFVTFSKNRKEQNCLENVFWLDFLLLAWHCGCLLHYTKECNLMYNGKEKEKHRNIIQVPRWEICECIKCKVIPYAMPCQMDDIWLKSVWLFFCKIFI